MFAFASFLTVNEQESARLIRRGLLASSRHCDAAMHINITQPRRIRPNHDYAMALGYARWIDGWGNGR